MTLSSVQKVGLFGGAFDPPHLAHRALAQAALQQLRLDVLHILPTGDAWHKTRTLSAAEHRLALCALAFGGLERTRVDPRETLRSGPTYTVDTLLELQREYAGAEFYLLMGADQAKALSTWHRYEEICRLAIICVATRPLGQGSDELLLSSLPAFARVQSLQMPPIPLSATEVRQRTSARESVDTLVSPSVARYIDQHHLYQTA